MKLVFSIDVEEEGLFTGEYWREPPGVENVRGLDRLEFISKEFGFPLTLLVSYRVARDARARKVLLGWKDLRGAEIGAHLHHWSTPPFDELPYPEPVPADRVPPALLRAKLDSLLDALRTNLGVTARSFRMGRFDLGTQVPKLLPELGLLTDSSIVPLRRTAGGPDHFMAPCEPYRLEGSDDRTPSVLEVPLTMIPLFPRTRNAVYRQSSFLPPRARDFLLTAYRHAAVVGVHPAWFSLGAMKLAANLHRARGGHVLCMFLHSSEVHPGATPKFRTESDVSRLVDKIRAFLAWLVRTGPVRGMTLEELRAFFDARLLRPQE